MDEIVLVSTVEELINELQKIEDKSMPVYFYNGELVSYVNVRENVPIDMDWDSTELPETKTILELS